MANNSLARQIFGSDVQEVHPGPVFSEHDIAIGAPAVYEAVGMTQEQRDTTTKEVSVWLAACTVEEVIESAQKVESLYSRSSTRTAHFGVFEVDVFAKAAAIRLLELESGEASRILEAIKRARATVGAQQHKNNLPPLISRED